MRVVLDTDVLLDVAFGREPFYDASESTLRWAQGHPFSAAVAWHCIANAIYLLRKQIGGPEARRYLADCLRFLEVPRTGREQAQMALASDFSDVDDALVFAAAKAFDADVIVTRNVSDFRQSTLPVMPPAEFIKHIQQ